MCAKVSVQLLNIFRLELKKQYLEYHGETIKDIILNFETEHLQSLPGYLKSSNKEHLNEGILILLNGTNIKNLDGMDTRIQDGDEIQLSVPIIGG